jgi:hypothetical protein
MNPRLHFGYWNQKAHLEGASFSPSTNRAGESPFRRGQVFKTRKTLASTNKSATLRVLQIRACSLGRIDIYALQPGF